MAYFAALDVSVKETKVCIVDDAGKIVREARVARQSRPLPDGAEPIPVPTIFVERAAIHS
jgi:transposase